MSTPSPGAPILLARTRCVHTCGHNQLLRHVAHLPVCLCPHIGTRAHTHRSTHMGCTFAQMDTGPGLSKVQGGTHLGTWGSSGQAGSGGAGKAQGGTGRVSTAPSQPGGQGRGGQCCSLQRDPLPAGSAHASVSPPGIRYWGTPPAGRTDPPCTPPPPPLTEQVQCRQRPAPRGMNLSPSWYTLPSNSQPGGGGEASQGEPGPAPTPAPGHPQQSGVTPRALSTCQGFSLGVPG